MRIDFLIFKMLSKQKKKKERKKERNFKQRLLFRHKVCLYPKTLLEAKCCFNNFFQNIESKYMHGVVDWGGNSC